MRTLYVVTHPEATHHVDGLVGGWYDASLTARGSEDAGRVAEELAARIPAGAAVRVVASDLRRTRETAAAIADRLGVAAELDPDLRERCYGVAEGQPPGTYPFQEPPATGDRLRHHDGVEGSETRWQVASRMYAALERVLADGTEHQVVVTHGGSATYLIAAWIGMPLESTGHVGFRLSPGGITVLRERADSLDRQVMELDALAHLEKQAH